MLVHSAIMARVKVRDLIHLRGVRRLASEEDQRKSSPVSASEEGIVVTVAGQPGKDVRVGTFRAILRSAGLEQKEEDR